MKKKIKCSILAIILLIIGIIIFIILRWHLWFNTNSAKEYKSYFNIESGFDEQFSHRSAIYVSSVRYSVVTIDLAITSGSARLRIYKLLDESVNFTDVDYNDPQMIECVYEELIQESDRYVYDFSTRDEGIYALKIDSNGDSNYEGYMKDENYVTRACHRYDELIEKKSDYTRFMLKLIGVDYTLFEKYRER